MYMHMLCACMYRLRRPSYLVVVYLSIFCQWRLPKRFRLPLSCFNNIPAVYFEYISAMQLPFLSLFLLDSSFQLTLAVLNSVYIGAACSPYCVVEVPIIDCLKSIINHFLRILKWLCFVYTLCCATLSHRLALPINCSFVYIPEWMILITI